MFREAAKRDVDHSRN